MSRIQTKSNRLWFLFFVCVVLFGTSEQTNSSVILSTITSSRVSSSPGNSSLASTIIYNGYLSTFGPTFNRPYSTYTSTNYYYQAIQVTVYTSATYIMKSSSYIDTYGLLYDTTFDVLNPSTNLIDYDDDSAGDRQFSISYYLYTGRTYILVVTTSPSFTSGSYSILSDSSLTPSMSGITTEMTTQTGSLWSNNPTFVRPGSSGSSYYYDSFRLTTSTNGLYAFRSSSLTSTDVYGCLYYGSFDPSNPLSNKLVCDDDSGPDFQFQFSQNLYSYNTYVLVVTTSYSYVTGSYSVDTIGPSSVSTIKTTPSTVVIRFPVVTVVSAIVGSVVFIIIILTIACIRRRRQQVIVSTYSVYPTYPTYPKA